jgi:hypothetical protein
LRATEIRDCTPGKGDFSGTTKWRSELPFAKSVVTRASNRRLVPESGRCDRSSFELRGKLFRAVSLEQDLATNRSVWSVASTLRSVVQIGLRTHRHACVLKLRVCGHPNPLRQRGIVLLRFAQVCRKSLADASGCDKSQCFSASEQPQRRNAQLQNACAGMQPSLSEVTINRASVSTCTCDHCDCEFWR